MSPVIPCYHPDFKYIPADQHDPLYLWRKFGFDKKPPQRKTK